MISATEYRAMAAEHHRLAGMCRSPESRERHLRIETELRDLADTKERMRKRATPPEAVYQAGKVAIHHHP